MIAFLLFVSCIAFADVDPALVPAETSQKLEPLWELGVGGGATFTPDYPGSNQNHLWSIPFPFAIYRGEILHSDRRGGTRARLYQGVSYEFNFSASGGLPSSSEGNAARDGMPNLEWFGELGPRLMIDLYSVPERALLRLGFPVRFAFSSNWEHVRDHGYTIAPELLYDLPHMFGSRFDFFTLLTANWADRRFQSYFYDVEPVDERAGRPAFVSRSGYLLSDLTFGIITNFGDQRLKLNTSVTFTSMAANANHASPLMKQDFNYSVGMVLIWVFAKSEDRVQTAD